MLRIVAKRLEQHVHTTLHLVGFPHTSPYVEWVPNTDIYETAKAFVVRVELPGMRQEDIQVQLIERTLIIRGHRLDPCRKGKCLFRQMEISYGAFERRLTVSRHVDSSHIKADYGNGFLVIELPKAEKSSPKQVRIAIREN